MKKSWSWLIAGSLASVSCGGSASDGSHSANVNNSATGGQGGEATTHGGGGSGGTGGSGTAGTNACGGPNVFTGGSSGHADAGSAFDAGRFTGDEDSGISCVGSGRSFPTFDKGCESDADCVLVRHQMDCCGSQTWLGIAREAQSTFDAAEGVCTSQYPPCGCAPRNTTAEDGSVLPNGKENAVVATCVSGTCTSRYDGATFGCGGGQCPDIDYCVERTPGTGGETSYGCEPLLGCTACSCVAVPTGCFCSDGTAGISVTCYGQ